MNYRHIYHAGNFADVIKHVVLVMVLGYLQKKEKAFFVLDTHGGIGLYDLKSEQAQKTLEGEDGIGRLWARNDIPAQIFPYMNIVRKENPDSRLLKYPGSPVLIRHMLRPQDRFVANELHPDDYEVLRALLQQDARIRIEKDDGYTQLRAKLPPQERRGVVLVDPPFEVENEFELMLRGLRESYARWPTGVYMFWYPIKDIRDVSWFHSRIQETQIPKIIALDFFVRKPDNPELFNGTGLVLVNAPFTLTNDIDTVMPWLVDVLTDGQGSFKIKTISGE